MKHIPIIIIVVLFLACGNGKGGKINETYVGGHGIGIDTATINQLDLIDDTVPVAKDVVPDKTTYIVPSEPASTSKKRSYSSSNDDGQEYDNMRGFDPASEDDMDDNGVSRYMENNDEEGWD